MSAGAPLLEVKGLGKKFSREIARSRHLGAVDILSELTLRGEQRKATLRSGEFWALDGIGFTLGRGEALGVIGHNGAGKSTLLRVLHGLLRPDTGKVTLRGSQAALIDLGAPFNGLLSGRENIATAASAHGLHHEDTSKLIEDVAEFSELADVLDAPFWTYSTGMQMRLGYSIATQLSPDIFFIDEVIAVGDIAFQRKCVSQMRKHLSRGGGLVLVSHDLWMIQALCHRCLVLSDGRIVNEDIPNRAISAYFRLLRTGETFSTRQHSEYVAPQEKNRESAVSVDALVCTGSADEPPRTGEPLIIEVSIHAINESHDVLWHLEILTADMHGCIARLHSPPNEPITIPPQGITVTCRIPHLPLFPGTFQIAVHFTDPLTGEEVCEPTRPVAIEVDGHDSRLEILSHLSAVLTSLDGRFSVVNGQQSQYNLND